VLGVVLDTNVLISAILSPSGNPALILGLVLDGKLQLYYTQEIMAEYQEALAREKFDFEVSRADLILETLVELGHLTNPDENSVPLPDETNRIFYDTAKTMGAFLITGNLRHYPEESSIITPRELIEKIKSQ
jgi:putative PIN family toxin of toxin-antitoxin system